MAASQLQLIKDINRFSTQGSGVEHVITINGIVYFAADDGVVGKELWQYNPSSSTGPVLVGDINVGIGGSYPSQLTEIGGVLYFTADDRVVGRELWQYDPSIAKGPVLLGDIYAGTGGSRPEHITKVGGILYFRASGRAIGEEETGSELWQYDPSLSSVPVLVADIKVGPEGSAPSWLTDVGGVLYFSASGKIASDETEQELWQYAPSSSTGPVLVGNEGGELRNILEIEGILYFSAYGKTANGEETGRELWQYDPSTSSGSVLVGDINVGTGGSYPENLTEVGGVLYFSASGRSASGEETGSELWQYDPSSSIGPVLVADINAGTGGSGPGDITDVEGILYFSANDRVTGEELWQYDPSASSGPVLVGDINVGIGDSSPSGFTKVGVVLYFTAIGKTVSGEETGRELWQYDPTASSGPVLLGDIYVGTGSSRPRFLSESGGVIYFSADRKGESGERSIATELWQYDPSTSSGPVLVEKINQITASSSPSELFDINGIAYFSADDGVNGAELWQYDPGASTGPVLVADINVGSGGSSPDKFTEVGGVLYFTADGTTPTGEETGRELWQYDPGSSFGPVLVGDINFGIQGSSPGNLIKVGGVLYFTALGKTTGGEDSGRELWQYDPGSSAGPVLVGDINAGIEGSWPEQITEVGGVLYFTALGKTIGGEGSRRELWQYDPGSSAGPGLLRDKNVGVRVSFPPYYGLTEVGGVLYFTALGKTIGGEETGRELWQYDPGLSAGLVLVGDINAGIEGSFPKQITEVGGILYFTAHGKTTGGEETGRELWQYDPGSFAGPILLGDINAGPIGSYPDNLFELNGVLYFSAIGKAESGEETGRELWQYDPSSSTALVMLGDINPSAGDGEFHMITEAGGVLYFIAEGNAEDFNIPLDLWQYDPSASTGPVLVDINARHFDAGSSNPFNLSEFGGNLYFSATDDIHGHELWGVINQLPVAVNDSYFLDANTTYTVESPGVLNNDVNVDGNIISSILDTTVSHGSLVLNSNGSFSYAPTAGYSGEDSFSYYFSDGTQDSEIATVTLTVNSISTNSPPVAHAGADQLMIEATGVNTNVNLDGSGTTDADAGDTITYQWFWRLNLIPQGATGISPVVSLPLGNHYITLFAIDHNGVSSRDTVKVSIVDTTAPAIGSVTDVNAVATLANNVVVKFALPNVYDAVDPSPAISCTANSGDSFVIGQTPVTCTATDALGNSQSTSFVVNVKDVRSTFESLWIPIETGSDDAEEMIYSTFSEVNRDEESFRHGDISLFSSDLELIEDHSNSQLVGLRYHLDIPAGATILSASIQFTADETDIYEAYLRVSAEASPDALTFKDLHFDISSRPLIEEPIFWALPEWSLKGEAGPDQQTPDLSTIVQKIVDQDDWVQGNAMAFIISGEGKREAESFDGTAAPVLNVTFYTAPVVLEAPVAVDDGNSIDVAYITNIEQPLKVANGAGDIVQRNDYVGFPVAEVSLFEEISSEGGLVSVNPDGSFSYTPANGFEGVDSFSYTLQNTEGSDSATVYIRVRNVSKLLIPVIIGSDDAEEQVYDGEISLNSA